MRTEGLELSGKCSEINDLSMRFAYLFAEDLSSDDKKKISDCQKENNGGNDTVKLEVNGVEYWLSKQDRKLYQETIKSINNKILNIVVQNKYKIKKKKNNISFKEKNRIYALVKSLKKEKSLLTKIILSHIYLNLGKLGKVESIINSILSQEYIDDFFDIEPSAIHHDLVEDKVIEILLELNEHFDDKKLVDTLVSYLSFDVHSETRSKIYDEFSIPNKLSYVHQRIKSVNYAVKFPFAWTFWIEKYSSMVELEEFLNRTEMYRDIKNGKLKALGLLRSLFPQKKTSREKILMAYDSINSKSGAKLLDLRFRMQLNEDFIKYLIKEKRTGKPAFVAKRKFYRKLLSNNKAISYSIYQLLKLGDLKQEYFIKALALRSYGL